MPRKTPSTETSPSLEKHLEELKQVVAKMEQKNLPLEESLALFERGIQLVRAIQEILNQAEQKIMILLQQKNADAELTPFEEEQ